MSVVRPASHCFACKGRVWARDNIPILRTFSCADAAATAAQFSPRYALVEAVTAALSALVFWSFVVDAPGEPLGVRAARFATYFALPPFSSCCRSSISTPSAFPTSSRFLPLPVFFLAGFAVHEVAWSERAIGAAAGYLLVRWLATATTTPPGVRVWAWEMASCWPSWAPCSAGSHSCHRVAARYRHPGQRAVLLVRRRRAAVARPAEPPSPTSPPAPPTEASGATATQPAPAGALAVRVDSQGGSPVWSVSGGQCAGLPSSWKAGVGLADAHAHRRVARQHLRKRRTVPFRLSCLSFDGR